MNIVISSVKMRSAGILLVIQLIYSVVCSCQTKMPLQDVSAKGSPLRLSGTMLYEYDPSKTTQHSYLIDGFIANVSAKGVILIIIHFGSNGVTGPALDYTYQSDHFFSSDILDAGKSQHFRSSPLRFGNPIVDGEPLTEETDTRSVPVSTAQVLFVQFVDGSTWGDEDSARESLTVRKKTFEELSRLQHVLTRFGEQALRNEISNADNLFPCIDSILDTCKDESSSCVADHLRSTIKAAKEHEAEMNSHLMSSFGAIR